MTALTDAASTPGGDAFAAARLHAAAMCKQRAPTRQYRRSAAWSTTMVMMLPFFTASLAIWFGLRGRREPCLWVWLLTALIYLIWCNYHMSNHLDLPF